MSILFRIVLAFVLTSLALALAQAQKKPVASPALEAEFNAFIAKFRAALKANDPAAVAGMTKLPFMGDKAYADVAQFRAKAYPEFFSAKDRACIQRKKAEYGRDGENNDNYFVICGESIFTFTRASTGFLFTEVGVND